ncbi:MAG: diguanylate cyclase domain-containing protein [Acidimicrobiales bacterium]
MLDTVSEPAFDDLVRLAATLMSVPWVAMNLVDDRRTWAKSAIGVPQGFEVPRDDSPFCAMAIGEPSEIMVIEDTLEDERYVDNAMTQQGVRFYAGAPLVTPEGHAIGTLCVSDRVPRTPTSEQLEDLATLAMAITAHLELRRRMGEAQELAVQLQHLAAHDALTGLANRRSFDGALAAAVVHAGRTGEPLGIVLLDLDHFKGYNDSHGHVAGDDLLRRCAQRWTAAIRDTDLLARYGGEEFAVIASGCDLDECIDLAERLRAAMPDSQTCSSGVTVWRSGERSDDFVRRADTLMYAAKDAGRDSVKW